MATPLEKAIILHTFAVQVGLYGLGLIRFRVWCSGLKPCALMVDGLSGTELGGQ